MRNIRTRLQGRSDFSPFLVHLTRGHGDTALERRRSARRKLSSILRNRIIEARKPHGLLKLLHDLPGSVPNKYLKAVCFTDIPTRQLRTVIGEIPGRQDRLDRYGLVFSKRFAMQRAASPVVYLCTEPGRRLAAALIDLIGQRLTDGHDDLEDVAPLLPLVETFGRGYINRNRLIDFHWEREWRVAGDLEFRRRDVLLGLCHHNDIDRLERRFRPIKFIDPIEDEKTWNRKLENAEEKAWDDYLSPFPR